MRINANELEDEYTDGGSLVMIFQGAPFTGVAYEISLQGTLWCEQSYVKGTLDGVSKSWYFNGQLEEETEYKWNRVHGPSREWHESGAPKSESFFELGVLLRSQEWDEQGRVQKAYEIGQDPAGAAKLERTRAFFRQYGLFPS